MKGFEKESIRAPTPNFVRNLTAIKEVGRLVVGEGRERFRAKIQAKKEKDQHAPHARQAFALADGLGRQMLKKDSLTSYCIILLSFLSASARALTSPPPLIICGPSGVGKGTLIARAIMGSPGCPALLNCGAFAFSCSHTTRPPRPNEVDGVHYHFVDGAYFDKNRGSFIETANVHGNTYGTSYDAVRAVKSCGKVCVLDLDVQGVKTLKAMHGSYKEIFEGSRYIFIAPPTIDVLEARLRGRGTESEEAIALRLRNAREEIDYGLGGGAFDEVVVNGDLEEASGSLAKVVEAFYGAAVNGGKRHE